MAQDRSLVRASDIGAWAYCRRAWWLANVRNVPHADPARLAAGRDVHRQHGRQVRHFLIWRRIGLALIACGAGLAIVLWLMYLLSPV